MEYISEKINIYDEGTIPEDYDNVMKYDLQEVATKHFIPYVYQIQTMNAMMNLEMNTKYINDNQCIQSNIGILANKVGSGKSICILGVIMSHLKLKEREYIPVNACNIKDIVIIDEKNKNANISGCNLIVCHVHLIHTVWELYIKQYTKLKYKIIKNKDFPIDWDNVVENDIIIISATNYNVLMRDKKCILFSRIIFDEVDSLQISACEIPKARFTWFVTSSIINLFFSNGYYFKYDKKKELVYKICTNKITTNGFIKNTCKQFEMDNANVYLKHIIIKMKDIYIDTFLNLPSIHEDTIICKEPYYIEILENVVDAQILQMLNSNDVDSAFEYMGIEVHTKDNIVANTCKDYNVKIYNLKRKLDYLSSIQKYTQNDQARNEEKINEINEKIVEIETKKNMIKEKIHDKMYAQDICSICTENVENILLHCCYNLICQTCATCIIKTNELQFLCPFCREIDLPRQNLLLFDKKIIKSKFDTLIDNVKKIMIDDQESKIIIYCQYTNVINDMLSHLKTYKIFAKKINEKNIELYMKNKLQVMILGDNCFNYGINLINTTHIIFYHKTNNIMKSQVLGRVYRHGRTQKLNITNLSYTNELT